MLWIEAAPPSSSRRVLQKLLPALPKLPPPGLLMSVTVVPCGDVRVTTRSPTHEWSSPTVVAPTAEVQEVPSKIKLIILLPALREPLESKKSISCPAESVNTPLH